MDYSDLIGIECRVVLDKDKTIYSITDGLNGDFKEKLKEEIFNALLPYMKLRYEEDLCTGNFVASASFTVCDDVSHKNHVSL